MFWKKPFCLPCLIVLVLVILIVGGYYLLRGGYQAPTPTSAPTPAPGVSPESLKEKIAAPEAKEFTVSGTEYSFSPSSISVKAGEQVTITFRNIGRISHNFLISGLGVASRTIGSGQTDVVEFTAPASGTYTIFCSVPGHRAAGMVGQLTVE